MRRFLEEKRLVSMRLKKLFSKYSQKFGIKAPIRLEASDKLHKLGKKDCISTFFALKYPMVRKACVKC